MKKKIINRIIMILKINRRLSRSRVERNMNRIYQIRKMENQMINREEKI
jgi:hypothetical protein